MTDGLIEQKVFGRGGVTEKTRNAKQAYGLMQYIKASARMTAKLH